MKFRSLSIFVLAIVVSASLLAQNCHCGAHDELAKKFVKLMIAAALLSPPGFGFAPVPLPLPIPIKINVNHEPIIGPPIPHPFLHGGIGGHAGFGGIGGGYGGIGGIGGLGGIGHGFGRRRRRFRNYGP